ncbi:MAG: hypothetical protein AVDCRST_MAG58-1947 [uncultured Rubrobacteraceae bacterium]|uniref:Uncharacterized protein n=1 Tax=uncultured Rubrobacteraceae bacterium TaxID=349277 RepID=A0A6J4R468_9ACTN|nr:MAG: hypothetical protein AVDCRST_MAG58-1947 [uncultured Rubrobacteraceae bacterium]
MPYPGHTREEIARRGREIYEREIRAEVEPEHAGRFLVVDVITGDYEVADDDLVASERLLARNPDAMLYGQPVGEPGLPSARIGSPRTGYLGGDTSAFRA